MKMETVHIKNFKSLEDVFIKCTDLVALIGENNSGKSNVLQALDFFFNPATYKINEESFYLGETEREIEISLEFKDLNEWEKKYFFYWLYDGKLKVKRKIRWNDGKVDMIRVAIVKRPKVEWLQKEKVNAEKINEWWKKKEELVIQDVKFYDFLGKRKPTVEKWKKAIEDFLEKYKDIISWEDVEKENPKGYANVLKGGLPEYILVPAVRYVSEEVKVQKTNPFGRLISALLRRISNKNKDKIRKHLSEINKLINKQAAGNRIAEIDEIEKHLKSNLCPFIECDVEINVPLPDFEDLFERVQVYIDDGVRTSVEEKGHGLRRSVIFAILRTYAELIRSKSEEEKEKERSIIFAIEEPELYLHPLAQRVMMEVLRDISKEADNQIIYSTHSGTFVNIVHFDEICLMRREQINDQWKSTITQLSMDDMIQDLKFRHPHSNPTPESMRERYSHVCSPVRSEGFFARKIVIVEGLTEEYVLPIYSKALGYNMDKEGVAVISSGGKDQIDRLYRLFNEFRIPCYIIFDVDKTQGSADSRRTSKELLELMGWSGADLPSSSIIERQFTAFEEKFEEVMKKEASDYSSLIEEAKKFLGVKEKTSLVEKYVANKLVKKGEKEGDPAKYVPPTIKEIIKGIKEVTWEGSILRKE